MFTARKSSNTTCKLDELEMCQEQSDNFILGRAHASMPPLQTQQPSTLSRQWKLAEQLATHIWKHLINEFIPTLLPDNNGQRRRRLSK